MGIWLRNAFQSGNWEQLLDITQAILDVEQENPYALLVLVVHAFTQDGDLVDAVDKLEDLCSILKEKYPHSIKISYTTSSLLSNICGRNTRSLNLIMDILDRLLRSELVPEHRSKVLTLQGRIRLMIPILQDSAERSLHEAMKVSSGYEPESVLGLVHSLLLADNCDDADSQLDLLMSMYSEGDLGSVPAEYHYLQALSMRLRSGNLFEMQGSEKERHISYLVACQKVLEEQNTTYSKRNPLFEPLFEPCLNIHAEMYVQLASEYFAHIDSVINIAVYLPKSCAGNSTLNCRQHQHNGASPISHSADSGFMLLHRLQQFSPGIVTSYIEIAQAKKKIGSPADGIQELEKCLAYQSRNAAVLVLKAHLEVANGSTADAVKSLEQAVSFDFAVRSSPLYLLTSAQINAQSDNFSDAIDELQKLIKSDKSLYSNESILNLKDVDYIGASLLLGYLYGHTKKLKEAKVVLEDAKKKFTGTSNVTQLLFQSALFAVEFKEYSTALQIIDQITCKHHLYAQAQKLKANTLLKNFRDQDGYLNIFQRLADERQCAQDFVALGDACMQVQRPEAAIKALEAACKLNTQPNSDLQSRIAKILVNTHQYLRAIECYEVAIADAQELPDTVKLSHDLANLLVKLGRGDAGIKTLRRISGKLEKNENAREKSLAVSTNILLANVLVKIEASANQIEETLLKAHDLQKEIVANAKGSQTESYKHLLADICVSLGDFYLSSKGEQNLHQCESCYSEALNFHASSLKALLGMTRFSLQVHDAERAISTASKLLAIDDTNEETVLLLSEAGELSKSSNNTIEPLLTFLQLNPNAYSVLARCIVYMNRAGRLNEIKHILNDNDRSPGAQYCKGLFALYENNCPLAVSLFNLLRSNSLWGSSALIKMLDIYLKPWKQFVLEAGSSTTARADTVEVHHSTTRKALLEQLRVIQQDKAQFDVIECYCIMASQIDKNGDSVRRTLSQILERDPNYTPAILALSIYHIIDGDTIKARTLLKQAVTTDNCGKHCDEYVTICLILAQGYLDQSKCAMAEEICYKCLSYDRSCAKAFELLGQAMEKEGDYSSAAQHFQKVETK